MPHFLILCMFLILLQESATAQQYDYSKADSIALSLAKKRFSSPEQLAHLLTDSLPSDHEKARAIFRWMTASITYDLKAAERFKKQQQKWNPKHRPDHLGNNRQERRLYRSVTKTFRKRKAICQGYSGLFRHLCSWVNLEAEVISGHSRDADARIGKYYKPTHAWNAVKLDGKWHLLDVTWASGHNNTFVQQYIKGLNDDYFLTPPHLFILDHYPVDKQWFLGAAPISVKQFYKQPLAFSGFFTYALRMHAPSEGIIRAEPGETVSIRFSTDSNIPLKDLRVYRESTYHTPASIRLPSELIKISATAYEAHICFPEADQYRFFLQLNNKDCLLYQAIIRPAVAAKK